MPPYVAVDRPPIRAAKFFESLLNRRRFTFCLEDHTPVRRSKTAGPGTVSPVALSDVNECSAGGILPCKQKAG